MKNQFGDKFPNDVVNALARMLLPEIQKAYESAESQAEFERMKQNSPTLYLPSTMNHTSGG